MLPFTLYVYYAADTYALKLYNGLSEEVCTSNVFLHWFLALNNRMQVYSLLVCRSPITLDFVMIAPCQTRDEVKQLPI